MSMKTEALAKELDYIASDRGLEESDEADIRDFARLAAARLRDLAGKSSPVAVDPNVQKVIEQMRARAQVGLKKYGVTTFDNPLTLKQWLQHALEETMDQAVYLQAAIEQIDRQERGKTS